MQEYKSKEELIEEIKKTAEAFIGEFDSIGDADGCVHVEGVERAPCEMIAYPLGWMSLLRGWDEKELAGEEFQMPAPGIKWNQTGLLTQRFNEKYQEYPLHRLQIMFADEVDALTKCFLAFSDDEVFKK
jgi:hypothetical protein